MTPPIQHVFFDYRGLVQLRLRTADDLAAIHELDPARWSATSVPVEQLLCDGAFLRFLDADGDGRVRVQDILAAHRWAITQLVDPARLVDGSDAVRVGDLSPEAARLKALLTERLAPGAAEVSLPRIREFAESYKKKLPNGDGVVAPAQIDDADVKALASAVVAFGDAPVDAGGEPGVDAKLLDRFVEHAHAVVAWESERTWDEAFDGAVAKADALGGELDRFFLLCDLVAQERAALEKLDGNAETLAALDVKDAASVRAYLEKVPLQRPTPAGILDVAAHLNPIHAAEVRALFDEALPLLMKSAKPVTRLSAQQWAQAKEAMKPVVEHQHKKPRDLGFAVDVVLAGASVDELRGLIDADQRASAELVGLADLERLALYQKWLLPLCNNMVSFPALFRLGERCMFEAGTLVLDGRNLSFCVHVADRAAHKAVAERANLFVVYVELFRKDGDTSHKREIACAVTSGTRRGIAVGKRGVFYDRDGREHDAVVVDVIERPISLWEAATAPFVRLRAFVAERIEKLTTSSLAAFEKRAASTVTTPPPADAPAPPAAPPAPPAPAPAPAPGGALGSLLVGGGIAVAAVGSAAAFIVQAVASVAPLHFLFALVTLAAAIMALSGFLGWLKLRRRDLSTILEACGWAFNVRIYLTRRHSLHFTSVPPLPPGSVRERFVMPPVGDDESGALGMMLFLLAGALVVLAILFREPILAWFR